jgi:alanine racemase
MDQTMIDVSAIENAAIGDEVVLIGTQGDLAISAQQLATLTSTIAWDVLCGIGARVYRLFVE